MKSDWKRDQKEIYQPQNTPSFLKVPAFRYFTLRGQGDPNEPFFGEYIAALYSLAYAVRMSPKQGLAPPNYEEYTVYPLEGVWDLSAEGRAAHGHWDKKELIFHLMIRQPDFLSEDDALATIERTRKKKPHPLLEQVKFETLEEGPCVQMMHLGNFDLEPASFQRMEAWALENHLERLHKTHREIYLSDFRKVPVEKRKTILRFQVRPA